MPFFFVFSDVVGVFLGVFFACLGVWSFSSRAPVIRRSVPCFLYVRRGSRVYLRRIQALAPFPRYRGRRVRLLRLLLARLLARVVLARVGFCFGVRVRVRFCKSFYNRKMKKFKRFHFYRLNWGFMVGDDGFEPPTLCL